MYVCTDNEIVRTTLADPDNVRGVLPVATAAKIVDLYNRDGDRHKFFRRNVGLSLTPVQVKSALPAFAGVVTKHTDRWLARAQQGQLLPVWESVRDLVLEVGLGPIAALCTGPGAEEQMETVKSMCATVQAGLFAAPIYFPGTTWYKAINTRPAYVAYLSRLADQRFPAPGSDPAAPPDPARVLRLEDDAGAPGMLDTTRFLLQEFYEYGDPPTVGKIAERLVQNVIGATETTAGLALSLVVVTALLPDVQRKLREEQAAVIKAHGRALTWEALSAEAAPYTDACIREAARLVPSVHGVFRKAVRDLQVGPYSVRAGTHFLVPNELLHALTDPPAEVVAEKVHAPAGWAERVGLTTSALPAWQDHAHPERSFKPERWLGPERPRYLHAFAWGPHSCLGKDVAILELKLVLVALVRAGWWEMEKPGAPYRLTFVPFTRVTGGPTGLRIRPDPL
eukprot:CAMPEP_0202874640 /NCGR_PEP_ID=MMETSP1391-20130828/25757_1 /ASSEMBLY_ACC=CAM_ASM_000867 /TAXON_ID=1034604 /ORGANISM="Chlamydomonas leiostraca, Strain SAG 11-49" /LENGTH=451 /DNA_ID=CAMNT_0049556127 /DNA_START=201 /DNA_END=1556 /DNA_ORIENTATION=+